MDREEKKPSDNRSEGLVHESGANSPWIKPLPCLPAESLPSLADQNLPREGVVAVFI